MKIKSAKFIRSYAKAEKMPNSDVVEFAFIGRSNVGKSSLINYLADKKNLALTSSKPGKTTLINTFLINDAWKLVDLPGYGYARVSQKQREKFSDLILSYLKDRNQLICAFVLIDSRLEPQAIDVEFIEWCGVNEVPFALIFTKSDKIKDVQSKRNIELFKAALHKTGWEEFPPIFVSSAIKRTGGKDILKFIGQCLSDVASAGTDG